VNRATFDFSGSRVLVTGGTSGIGNAIAVAFRGAGAAVTVTGTRESATAYESDMDAMGYHQLVMADREAIDLFAQSVSTLDVLVNNAGANFPGGRDEWEPDVFEESVALNLSGAFRLTTGLRNVLRASPNAGGASVVNIISMASYLAVPIVPGYGSAKAGLLQLTRNLAAQWAPDAIRVNAIAPGVIETRMTAPIKDIPALADETLAHVPMGRWGTVGEVAPAVLYLCSEQASYITGHALAVDGGYLIH
jgi:NAD(P)-dependent dehydrogenase (short-subunit alcohol dehydrogenase family)